jgi:hypothetical protein
VLTLRTIELEHLPRDLYQICEVVRKALFTEKVRTIFTQKYLAQLVGLIANRTLKGVVVSFRSYGFFQLFEVRGFYPKVDWNRPEISQGALLLRKHEGVIAIYPVVRFIKTIISLLDHHVVPVKVKIMDPICKIICLLSVSKDRVI